MLAAEEGLLAAVCIPGLSLDVQKVNSEPRITSEKQSLKTASNCIWKAKLAQRRRLGREVSV